MIYSTTRAVIVLSLLGISSSFAPVRRFGTMQSTSLKDTEKSPLFGTLRYVDLIAHIESSKSASYYSF